MEEGTTMPTNQPEAEETQQSSGPDLTIQDLLGLKSVVDVATQRGAFKAGEMEAIGKLYNRLNTFLEAANNKKD